jgi:hypothetical protein
MDHQNMTITDCNHVIALAQAEIDSMMGMRLDAMIIEDCAVASFVRARPTCGQ